MWLPLWRRSFQIPLQGEQTATWWMGPIFSSSIFGHNRWHIWGRKMGKMWPSAGKNWKDNFLTPENGPNHWHMMCIYTDIFSIIWWRYFFFFSNQQRKAVCLFSSNITILAFWMPVFARTTKRSVVYILLTCLCAQPLKLALSSSVSRKLLKKIPPDLQERLWKLTSNVEEHLSGTQGPCGEPWSLKDFSLGDKKMGSCSVDSSSRRYLESLGFSAWPLGYTFWKVFRKTLCMLRQFLISSKKLPCCVVFNIGYLL